MIFDDKFVGLAKEIFQETNDLEAVVATLKEKGANQMQTTQAICRGLGMKLAEVDRIVLSSASWSEQRDYNNNLRDHFFNDDKS